MTATPPIVVIALAATELSAPRTAAILKSAHEVLGRNVTVRVEVFDESNNSENSAAQRPTFAYAWLAWDMRDPRVAHLRCFVPESKRWVKRDVTFTDQDPQTERGRTIGFVIASIFVEAGEPQSQPVVRVPQVPKNQWQSEPKGFLVAAAASIVAPGDATSLGAWIGAQRTLSRIFWLGLAGEGRIGAVTPAQASTRFFSLGALSTIRFYPRAGRAWWGLQSLLGVERLSFVHLSADDVNGAVTQSAWVPKLEILAHGNLDLTTTSMVFVDLGTNYRFGSTDVYVHHSLRAHIPAFVGVGRIGVGTRF